MGAGGIPDGVVSGWFRECSGPVMAYLCHRVDEATAQDLLQEVFVVAWRNQGRVPEPPVAWLIGVARRVLSNHVRAGRRYGAVLQEEGLRSAGGAGVAGTATRRADLTDLLVGLSAADQEVLTLSAWYDLSPGEAAVALGCSPNAYAQRLSRARNRLGQRLAADRAAEDDRWFFTPRGSR